MKKRILMMFPKASDATSLWRGVGPWKALARKMEDEIEFVDLDQDLNWSVLWGFDMIFMQRPSNVAHKAALNLAKEMGVKVWLDYDDDLLNVPKSNPAHLTYNDRDVQRDVMAMISQADLVSVSTKNLQQKYSEFNKNTFTIPNAWNSKMFHYRDPEKVGKTKVVLWRGTRTHAEDLDTYLDQISNIANKFKDWKFVFIGGAYWKIHQAVPEDQLSIIEPMEQTRFYRLIYNLNPKVMIVPLADHSFNRAKSNIAWQEAAFCGATALCPNWEEWNQPGAVLYDNRKDFEIDLEIMLEGGIDLAAHNRVSWAHISSNLRLDKINLQREDLLRQVLGI